ncbi:MAG: hypothetical protein WBF99_18240 [Xanthobacteraceae bacterium]
MSSRLFHRSFLQVPRRTITLLVLMTYLCVGALHGLCDLELSKPSGSVVVSLVQEGTGHSDAGIVADHHCHGCFSVSVPAPLTFATISEVPMKLSFYQDADRRVFFGGIDLPPPKA